MSSVKLLGRLAFLVLVAFGLSGCSSTGDVAKILEQLSKNSGNTHIYNDFSKDAPVLVPVPGQRGEKGEKGERGPGGPKGKDGAPGKNAPIIYIHEKEPGQVVVVSAISHSSANFEDEDETGGAQREPFQIEELEKSLGRLILIPLLLWGIRETWKHVLTRLRVTRFLNVLIGDLFPLIEQHMIALDPKNKITGYAGRPEQFIEQLISSLNTSSIKAFDVLWKFEISAINTFIADLVEMKTQLEDAKEKKVKTQAVQELRLAEVTFNFWADQFTSSEGSHFDRQAFGTLLVGNWSWGGFLVAQVFLVILGAVLGCLLFVWPEYKSWLNSNIAITLYTAGPLFFVVALARKWFVQAGLVAASNPVYQEHINNRLDKRFEENRKSPPFGELSLGLSFQQEVKKKIESLIGFLSR